MIKTVEKFCSEKRLRFGYGFEGGLNDFFRSDANGVYVIIGRPRVGVTEGDIVMRGNAVQYRDELAAMLGRNGNRVSRSDNRLHVVFRIARPMSSGGTGYQPTPPTPSADYLYFEAKQANSTVSMISMLTTAPTLEYSEDGNTWQTWNYTTTTEDEQTMHTFDTITLANIGDKVYLRGTNAALVDTDNGYLTFFTMSGSIDGGGSLTSIFDNDGVTLTSGMFTYLFYDMINGSNTALVTPPTFGNVTEIPANGCGNLFFNCTALTTPVDLSKITTLGDEALGNNQGICMYAGCSSLQSASDMGNVTTFGNDCCFGMYYGCTSLTLISDGALTFDFPALPITAGGTTYSTAQDIVDWMQPNI